MKTLQNWLFSGILLMMISTVFSQGKITGTLIDAESNMSLPGVNVFIKGTTLGTTTDIEGKFSLNADTATGQIVVSYLGYETKTIDFSVTNSQTVDLGTILLVADSSQLDEVVIVGKGIIDLAKDRKTPIAVSTIKAVDIQEKTGSSDITQSLINTPSVYVAGQAGGFGDSRIAVRGFGQDNTAFLLNGQPINGMEDGLMYWSNWSGMSDIANFIQVQRGLGSSKLAISSVGGTVNFITKATDKKEGGFVATQVANDNYFKTTAAYNTGINKNGFGVSVMLTHWQGDGYNQGTYGEGQNYFISFGYKPNERHNFNFLITGAPQEHDQNFTKAISSYLKYGRKYNNNYGYLNGEYLSERTNFYHKPVANLNWDWDINNTTSLSTVLYASWGRGGGTGNYGASAKRTPDGKLDFDAIVAANTAADGEGQFGNGTYLIRSSMNNHNWYGLVTNLQKQLTKNLAWNAGFDLRTYYGTHYRQVENFLGLNSWTESRRLRDGTNVGVGDPVFNTVTESQSVNPWGATFNSLGEDQRIDYDNSERISYAGAFTQLEYSTSLFSAFVQGAISNQSHQRFDRYDYLPAFEDSEKVSNTGYNVKAGASVNINNQNAFYVNAGYYSRQPYHDNIYLNFTNQVNPLTKNEIVFGLEAGYSFKTQYFSANLNAYRTSWKDRVKTTSTFTDEDETINEIFVPAGTELFTTNEGVEQLHTGLELDFVAKPLSNIDIRGFVSAGNWEYQDKVVTTVRDDNRQIIDQNENDVDGGKVGDAAQFTAGLGTKIILIERLSVDADYRFNDKLYANTPANKQNLELPSFDLLDAGISYKILVGKDKQNSVGLRLNVNNVLDKVYLSELRTRQIVATEAEFNSNSGNGAGLNAPPPATPAYSSYQDYKTRGLYEGIDARNQGYFGLGRTWNFTVRYNF